MGALAITPKAEEIAMANLIRTNAGQQRIQMIYDPILNMVARAKAKDLIARRYVDHVDPDGYGPNKAAQLAGYVLPEFWGTANDSNYIESLTVGYTTAASAFANWMSSPGHKQHVLGEIGFYAGQTHYGVGYAYDANAPYRAYWVFVSAPPNLSSFTALEPYAEWLFDRYTPKQIDQGTDADDSDGDGIGRLMEFVLSFDPKTKNTLTRPVLSSDGQRLEWTLSIRPDLGTIQAEVRHCPSLRDWTTDGVHYSNGLYWVDITASTDFMRLEIERAH